MLLRVGCEFKYETTESTAAVLQVQPRQDDSYRMMSEVLETTPARPFHEYRDQMGNVCQRFNIPPGTLQLRYDAVIETSGDTDPVVPHAPQVALEELPDEALIYMLPSRYCLSDILGNDAWRLFGDTPNGWSRVQAICDWVQGNIRFTPGSSNSMTSAFDVYQQRMGVCRDFAHLGVTFCRAMNIPARYVFGYLPDINVPPPYELMDFCAWFEAYLGGRWYAFDPRNNTPRVGRIVVGRGRDAVDVAMITSHGPARLLEMRVWADEVSDLA